MGELKEAKSRWSQKMPKFFKKVMWLCGIVSGTAIAVNTAMIECNITPDDWWTELFKYLVSVPTGMMFVCKMTVAGGVSEDKESKNTELNQDNF